MLRVKSRADMLDCETTMTVGADWPQGNYLAMHSSQFS